MIWENFHRFVFLVEKLTWRPFNKHLSAKQLGGVEGGESLCIHLSLLCELGDR